VLTATSEEHAESVVEARINEEMAKSLQEAQDIRVKEERRRRAEKNKDQTNTIRVKGRKNDTIEIEFESDVERRSYEGMDWHAKQAFIAMKQKQMMKKLEEGEQEEVEAVQANIVIKADTQGSLDSIRAAIDTFPQEKVKLNVLQTMVGNVAKSDVFKAESFEASIFAFNVNANKSMYCVRGCESLSEILFFFFFLTHTHTTESFNKNVGTKKAAEKSNVNLFTYDVIYSLLDGVKDFMVSRLEPLVEEKQLGSADVLQVIPLGNGKVMAAGCRVEKGTIKRGSVLRLLRQGEEIARKRNAMSMKHFSDDVSEAKQGSEFAIVLDKSIVVEVGDVIESIEEEEIPQTL